jgi:hypothetical protein
MPVACFDTSTINNLLAHPEVDRLTDTLLQRYDIYITALNVAEIAKTTLPEKREQLRAFEKRLSKTFKPLDLPNQIVMKVTAAFGTGRGEIDLGVTEDRRGLWVAMSEPHSVGEPEREELRSCYLSLRSQVRSSIHKIARWGCGTCCSEFAIVNLRTGAVYFPPFYVACPEPMEYTGDGIALEYRPDSRLIVVTGARNEAGGGVHYYVWTGKRLRPVFSANR